MVNSSMVSLVMETLMVNVSTVKESNSFVIRLISFLATQCVLYASLNTYFASGKDFEVP